MNPINIVGKMSGAVSKGYNKVKGFRKGATPNAAPIAPVAPTASIGGKTAEAAKTMSSGGERAMNYLASKHPDLMKQRIEQAVKERRFAKTKKVLKSPVTRYAGGAAMGGYVGYGAGKSKGVDEGMGRVLPRNEEAAAHLKRVINEGRGEWERDDVTVPGKTRYSIYEK